MFLRTLFRVPMNTFNAYQAMPAKHPQLMNYAMAVQGMIFLMVMGKGAEKFTISSSLAQTKAELQAAITSAEKK